MTRYYLSTPKQYMTVTVDENNIILNEASLRSKQFIGEDLDVLLIYLKEDGQVEMMEI